jgi:putative glutamine amidotransferase
MKPTIGITRCSKLDDYIESVKRAGGVPVVLDPADDPQESLSRVDGLLLTGGPDVDPSLYGQTPHPSTVVDRERDEFEVPLSREAVARDVPLFAICRGVQVLNVAAGGTLMQDIPSAIESELDHSI